MSRRKRRRPSLGQVAKQIIRNQEESQRAHRLAADLTAGGFPPGHPLRTLCLLNSGTAAVALHIHEATQAMLDESGRRRGRD